MYTVNDVINKLSNANHYGHGEEELCIPVEGGKVFVKEIYANENEFVVKGELVKTTATKVENKVADKVANTKEVDAAKDSSAKTTTKGVKNISKKG